MFPLEHDGHYLMSIALGGVYGGPVLDEVKAAQQGEARPLEHARAEDLERAVYLLGVLGEVDALVFVAGVVPLAVAVRAELARALLASGEPEQARVLAEGLVEAGLGLDVLARLAARAGDLAGAKVLVERGRKALPQDLGLHRLAWRLAEPPPYVDRFVERAEAVGHALDFGLELRSRLQNAHGWAIDDVLLGLCLRARALDPLYPEAPLLRVEAAVTGA